MMTFGGEKHRQPGDGVLLARSAMSVAAAT
jgi:hypothetical protein